jgi:hypothetical protein
VVVRILFGVETIQFRGAPKSELTLNAEMTATDMKRNMVIMRGTEKLPISAVDESTLEKAPSAPRNFITREAVMPAVRTFLNKHLEFLSRVLKIYSSDKQGNVLFFRMI